jgi:hypothetical protein
MRIFARRHCDSEGKRPSRLLGFGDEAIQTCNYNQDKDIRRWASLIFFLLKSFQEYVRDLRDLRIDPCLEAH